MEPITLAVFSPICRQYVDPQTLTSLSHDVVLSDLGSRVHTVVLNDAASIHSDGLDSQYEQGQNGELLGTVDVTFVEHDIQDMSVSLLELPPSFIFRGPIDPAHQGCDVDQLQELLTHEVARNERFKEQMEIYTGLLDFMVEVQNEKAEELRNAQEELCRIKTLLASIRQSLLEARHAYRDLRREVRRSAPNILERLGG